MNQSFERVMYVLFVILACFSYTLTVLMNYFSSSPNKPPFYFNMSMSDLSDKYYIAITPAGAAFSIWGVIYTWEAVLLIYGCTTIFRKGVPEILSPLVCVFYILARATNVGWIILFHNEWLNWSGLDLFVYTLFMYIAIFLSYRRYAFCLEELEMRWKKDLYAIRILIQNGFAVGTTWITIATLLNITMILVYNFDVSMDAACTIALCLLLVEALIWYVLENFVFDNILRYTWSIWPVVMWALGFSLKKNWNKDDSNSILTAFLLSLVVVLFTIRLIKVLFVKRCQRSHDPLHDIDIEFDQQKIA